MHVRRGIAADCAAINKVEISAGALFLGTHMEWAMGETTPTDVLIKAAQTNQLWIAAQENILIGFLLSDVCGGDFYIKEIAVDPVHQRRGVGRALIEEALRAAKIRGFNAATLTTDRILSWNAPYYERLGFCILKSDEMPAALAATLAAEVNPQNRCAMRKSL